MNDLDVEIPAMGVQLYLPPEGPSPCRGGCGCDLSRPGICADCAARLRDDEHRANVAAWVRALPARYRDATWKDLQRLTRTDGRRRIALSPERLSALMAQTARSDIMLLIGPPGSGKTTFATAALRTAAESVPGARVRFIPALDLLREETPDGGPTPLALALSADHLVVDDLGTELEGAPVGSGLLAQRCGAAARLISERFDRMRPMIITTNLDAHELESLYGARIIRRLFEESTIARFDGR